MRRRTTSLLTRQAGAALFRERNGCTGRLHSIMVRASGSYGRPLIGVAYPVINLAPETGAWIIGDGVKPPV